MRVMGLDDKGNPTWVNMGQSGNTDELHKVKHAYKHWRDYQGAEGKYEEISKHAWEAFLIALDDFFTGLTGELNEFEKNEFKRFWDAQPK